VKRRIFLLACASGLAACATAPKEDIRTRPFAATDFFALDPAVLRAAVLTDERAVFQAVDIEVRAGTDRYVFRLQQLQPSDPRLPVAPAGSRWQVFALSSDQAAALGTVRQLLSSRAAGAGETKVAVLARSALVPADLLTALPLRVEMLVDGREGWFTQIAATTIDSRPGN
jgi:hypothetical protein